MSALFGFLLKAITSRIAGPVGLAAAIGLGLLLLVANVEKAGWKHASETWRQAWIKADVARQAEQSNRMILQTAIDRQNAAVQAWRAAGAQKMQAAEGAVAAANRGRASAEARAAQLLHTKATGDDCDQIRAADRAVLESLK